MWGQYGFKSQVAVRSLGRDAVARRLRRNPTARARLLKASERSRRLLRLKNAGASLGNIQRAGPRAAGLWGSAVAGLCPKQLHSMRLAAARSLTKDKSGALMSLRLRTHPVGARRSGMVLRGWMLCSWHLRKLWTTSGRSGDLGIYVPAQHMYTCSRSES
eukprot:3336307-Pyramimonas_sp.AAC.1